MEEVKLGKYRHFKGNEYEVIGMALRPCSGQKPAKLVNSLSGF